MSETQNANYTRMNGGIVTYLKQSYVVMKNEIVKFTRGKKMLLFTALIFLVLILLTAVPYILGEGLSDNATELAASYSSFIALIVLLFATLFASTSLVSEFEERTALILFTRPVKKSSILLGKLTASMVIGIAFLAFYYIFTSVVSLAVAGSVDATLLTSFGLAVLYLFCMVGIALLISSVMKKGSTATIITFVMSLLIFSIISTLLGAYDVENWWLPDIASSAIYDVFGFTFGGMMPAVTVDLVQTSGVFIVWGLVTTVIAYFLFKRRSF